MSDRRTDPSTIIGTVLADVACVLAFAASGRATHQEGMSIGGILNTAWPFLVALVAAWLISRGWGHPTSPWPTGTVLWAVTVVAGLGLRAATGGGLAGGFPYVAAGVLALFLIGWRVVARGVMRLRSR